MKKEKDVITQVVSKNRWGNPEIIKKDFLLIPLFIFFQILTPIIIVFGVLGVTAMVTQQPPPSYLYNVMLSLSFVIAQFIVLGLFFTLHKFYITSVVRRQYRIAIHQYLKLIIITVIVSVMLYYGFNALAHMLPHPFGYVDTQAQRRLEGLFIHPSALIFTFISVVLLRPLIDELLFRHLLIHELGKKFNLLVMMIVSVLIETIVQVYDLISILEAMPYMIISIGAVIVYMKSGKNLAVSYLYHSTVQLIIFIITMIDKLV